MPPYPGEERLVTVFADIHYYFAPPTVRPVLHRFDKASYFYIYYNTTRHTSRIEIANNPGTPEQDAFNGYIDSCRIINSYKFPTLLTLVVDAVPPQSPTSPRSGRDPEEWHLASGDPRDPNRTKYRLHTIDIYLWAQEDAKLVIECFKKLLPPTQLDVAELEPESPYQTSNRSSQQRPANALSPVVQNLENMAIQDPAYNGQQRNNTVSPSSPYAGHSVLQPPSGGPSGFQIHSPSPTISDLSGKPPPQPSIGNSPKPQSQDFTPMAYNPAAPAAPEPIKHREKTPPPEDGTAGTGLAQAARHDQGYVPGPPPQQQGYQIGQGPPVSFGGGYASPPPQQPGYSSPPPPPPQQQQGYASPPPQQQQGYSPQPPGSSGHYGVSPQSATASFNSPPPPSGYSYGGQTDHRTSATSVTPSFGPGAPSTMPQGPRHSTAAETYVPVQPHEPVMTPGSQFYNSLSQSSKPLAHVQPQYPDYLSAGNNPVQQQQQQSSSNASGQLPLGGYSQYSYGSSAQPQQQGSENPYDVHQQVYRPTEAEAAHQRKQSRPSASDGRKASTTDKLEGKARGLFKKIEKRIG